MPILGKKVVIDDDGTEWLSDDVELTQSARKQGVYVIGTSGTGKTSLLRTIAYQDMLSGDGLCVIDPHGDMIDDILLCVPPERQNDVIVFAPGDPDQQEQPLGLNLFAHNPNNPYERDRVVSTVIDTLYKLFFTSWGPRMEDLLRSATLALLEQENTTFLHLWLLISSDAHRKEFTKDVKDAYLRQYWNVQFPRMTANDRDMVELIGSSLNKLGRFLADPMLRRIVAQSKSAFDLKDIMDSGKILLVNLSKGFVGEDNAKLLGAVLVNQMLIAALRRRDIPQNKRRQFHLIVDEYQNFATAAFPTLQSEARKYAVDVIVAHQYRDQLDDLNLGSTLNVANFIVLRVSGRDSFELASQFDNTPPPAEAKLEPAYVERQNQRGQQYYTIARDPDTNEPIMQYRTQSGRSFSDVQAQTANDLATLYNHRAVVRLISGRQLIECQIQVPDPDNEPRLYGKPNARIKDAIRQRSLSLGKPKDEIEREIEALMGDLDFGLSPGHQNLSDE